MYFSVCKIHGRSHVVVFVDEEGCIVKSVQRQDVTTRNENDNLVHAANQTVDVELTVTCVTAFDKVSELALGESTVGAG